VSEPTIRIELPGSFSLKQGRLERLIRLLRPLFELEIASSVVIDLSRLVSLSPAALALLAASLHAAEDRELMTNGQILPPLSPPVRIYLQRMNLLRSVPGFAHVDEPFERRKEEGFRGCLSFVDDTDYARVASELTNALAERCATDDVARGAVRVCLDEVTENVVHHANAPAGFAAAQGWRKNREFEIAIVDLGIGIRASLTANASYAHIATDEAAIAAALRPQVTSTPDRNAGIGLFITKHLLKANGGSLFVRSGYGAVYAGSEERVERMDVNMPGTIVALRARTDMPFDLNAVYALLGSLHEN